uniref:Uncharacterized protein n=1 Tax=Cacopsylla melanoneura TaxID=428564 RepID=A0A8D8YMC1_9HEMI
MDFELKLRFCYYNILWAGVPKCCLKNVPLEISRKLVKMERICSEMIFKNFFFFGGIGKHRKLKQIMNLFLCGEVDELINNYTKSLLCFTIIIIHFINRFTLKYQNQLYRVLTFRK